MTGRQPRTPILSVVALLVTLLLVACSGEQSSLPTSSTSASTVPATTSTEPTTTSTSTTVVEVLEYDIVLEPVGGDHAWHAAFVVPYGTSPDTVGSGLGEPWGPDLPVVRDTAGHWWVLDTYQQRIGVFSDSGELLREIPLEPGGPVRGLRVFDDGTALGISTRDRAVHITDTAARYLPIRALFLDVIEDDGTTAYGRSGNSGSPLIVGVGDDEIEVESVSHVRTRAGKRYWVSLDPGTLNVVVVSLPDASPPVQVRLSVRADEGEPGPVIFEPASDREGRIHLLLWWEDRASYVLLEPDGTLATASRVPRVIGDRDPGSAFHLGVDPITGQPHIAVVDDDALRVWRL